MPHPNHQLRLFQHCREEMEGTKQIMTPSRYMKQLLALFHLQWCRQSLLQTMQSMTHRLKFLLRIPTILIMGIMARLQQAQVHILYEVECFSSYMYNSCFNCQSGAETKNNSLPLSPATPEVKQETKETTKAEAPEDPVTALQARLAALQKRDV